MAYSYGLNMMFEDIVYGYNSRMKYKRFKNNI
jgi:hypothetical protein